MKTHAGIPEAATISARIAQLPRLSMDDLWRLWDQHFDDRPGHHHRLWIEGRLAYKIQEREFGGLRASVRRKLESIGETGLLPNRRQRDADRLLPGTVLTRVYDDVEHRCTVHGPRDFEYNGLRFKSLTAVARAVTGCPWSGPVFFGLKPALRKKASA